MELVLVSHGKAGNEAVMTKEEILNMPAGLEMDKLIQSFVMDGLPPVSEDEMPFFIKAYSTNILAAWGVVYKLGLMVRPSVLVGKWVSAKFERVYLSGKWEGIGEATAETAPLAICRAALLAVCDD